MGRCRSARRPPGPELCLLIDQRATWRLGAEVQEALASGSLVRVREALRPLVVEFMAPDEVDRLEAAELYLASRLAIDPDHPMEQAYPEGLASRLSLPRDLVDHLEGQAAAAMAWPLARSRYQLGRLR